MINKISSSRSIYLLVGTLFLASILGAAGTNVALNKPTTAGSSYYVYTPGLAVDGDVTTYWNGGGHGSPDSPYWLKVDLQGVFNLQRVVLRSPGGSHVYDLFGSIDDTNWTQLATGIAVVTLDPINVDTGGSAFRYLRCDVVGGSDWAALAELEAYATTAVSYHLNAAWGDGASTSNPSGAWSLRYGSDLLPLHYYLPSESAWVWDWNYSTVPSFAFETLTKWNDCLPGDVVMQGASGSPHANILWTTPGFGTITVSGRTWDAYGGRSGQWSLSAGGTQVAGGGISANSKRTSTGVSFAENVTPGRSISNVSLSTGTQVVFVQDSATSGVVINVVHTPLALRMLQQSSNSVGLSIDGLPGLTCGIQATTNLANINGWIGCTNVTLTVIPTVWTDVADRPCRFYRVVPGGVVVQ
jgi:hypothetical protein